MSAKFTPGPWTRVDVSTGSATMKEQMCSNGRAALLVQHDGSDEGKANARLIAAAPELLAVCELAMRFAGHECAGKMTPCTSAELYAQARAAIAKAEWTV